MRVCSRYWPALSARGHCFINATRKRWFVGWTGLPILSVTTFPSCWKKRRGNSRPTIPFLSAKSGYGVFRVVIPARYASARLPGKALMSIGGKPMVQWVYERARASGAEDVLIATDDLLIVSAGHSFGSEVVMTSASHTSGTDRIAEVARKHAWSEDQIVVNVQGDEPLIPPALIKQVAQLLETHPRADIATLASPIESLEEFLNPNVVKVVSDRQGRALYFSRAPIPWSRDGASAGLASQRAFA